MKGLPTCRTGGFQAQLHDGVAYCPGCGWEDKNAKALDGELEGFALVSPHKPLRGVLVRERDAGGLRDFLDEKPVACSTQLQLRWWTGQACAWLPCRYELDVERRVVLFVTLPSADGREVSASIRYTRELGLRWPLDKYDDTVPRYVDRLACRSCGSRTPNCGCAPERDRHG